MSVCVCARDLYIVFIVCLGFFFTSVSRCWLQLVTHFFIAGKTIGHMRWKQLSEKRNRKEWNEWRRWRWISVRKWQYGAVKLHQLYTYTISNGKWEKKSFGSEWAELPFRVWRYHLHNEIVIVITEIRRNIVTRHKIHTRMAIRAI